MAHTATPVPEPAEVLRSWLLEGRADVGEVHVVGADVEWDDDADGNPILRFNVLLANPSGETWSVDDIVEFHRRVEDQALDLGLDTPRYVGVQAETSEELDRS